VELGRTPYRGLHDRERALAQFARALHVDPGNTDVRVWLARPHREEDALEWQSPNSAGVVSLASSWYYQALGDACRDAGRTEDATDAYQRAPASSHVEEQPEQRKER